jgi:hypothetical protein
MRTLIDTRNPGNQSLSLVHTSVSIGERMSIDPNFNSSGIVALGVVLLLTSSTIVVSRITYADENQHTSPEMMSEIDSATAEQDSSATIEEIIVYGDKPLRSLRKVVYRTEENFFDVFNSLNQDDDYKVRCYYEVPSFTHIRRHVCRAKFVVDATSAEAARFMGKGGAAAMPAEFVIRQKREQFREILEALIAERPELLQALSEYTKAKQTLDSEKRRRTGK